MYYLKNTNFWMFGLFFFFYFFIMGAGDAANLLI
ncbi:hypothetical protein A1YK_02913 [Escherichia coli KTE134]|nr:hypothetical protein A15Q_00549 [Escherichia coli KTE208]EOW53404.1 hypothetical protein A1YK_02913 [Escherichia coli KTE134]